MPEVHGSLGWHWISAASRVTVSDGAFMAGDAHGTWYGNLSAKVSAGETGVSLRSHIVRWNWAGNAGFLRACGLDNDVCDLTDWKLGATIDWRGMNFGVFHPGSAARDTVATAPGANPGGGDRFAARGHRFGHNTGNDSL